MPSNPAPAPACGTYADGFAPLAQTFADHLSSGAEIGAGLCVYHRGEPVVDLWGGLADVRASAPWTGDSRIVVFSVTKGLAAMAMLLLADRGKLELDAPVAQYWPGFARGGKEAVTVRTLLNHRAGVPVLDTSLALSECVTPEGAPRVLEALESQTPVWTPGTSQGYHATTYGMYVRELFERVSGRSMGDFLRAELLDPLDSDAWLGAPASLDPLVATLYPPSVGTRVLDAARTLTGRPDSPEARVIRDVLSPRSLVRGAFANPRTGPRMMLAYNDPPVRRAQLAWASATASARGIARAYLPFAQGGSHAGRTYVQEKTLAPVYERQSFSDCDTIVKKALGWSQGFLKEDGVTFGPSREAFGHAGMGGALGWCDPVRRFSLGYVMNKLDGRVRSPRIVALCDALYRCEPLRS
jgi:CubicO group peptidase (beta-lactamase class C family)